MTKKSPGVATLAEIAPLLGVTGSRVDAKVIRRIRAIEQRTGSEILLQTGEGTHTRYMVSLGVLEANCPQLFAAEHRSDEAKAAVIEVDKVANAIAERFSSFDDRLDELSIRDEVVGKEIAKVRNLVRAAHAELQLLREDVAEIRSFLCM